MKCLNILAYCKNIRYKMPNLIIKSKYLINSLNYKFLFVISILIIYFTWMDIALFFNLQKWTPYYNDDQLASSSSSSSSFDINNSKPNSVTSSELNRLKPHQSANDIEITVFNPLSVKLIMVDHMSHYVHDVLARFIENKLHFSDFFPWVTPNLVSFTGLALAVGASKLVMSDKLSHRRFACLLFELRNFADSLDGVVYRSRAKRGHTYESIRGTLGYNVDIICDGLGGLVFVLAILIRLVKNPPHRCKLIITIFLVLIFLLSTYYYYYYYYSHQIDVNLLL